MTDTELIRAAFAAREYAYAPYSHFKVGAALLCADGRVFTGCNVENAAYAPSQCAERTAVGKAVSEGARDFTAIAIVGAPDDAAQAEAVTSPCGVCRQTLFEFGGGALRVLMARSETDYLVRTLEELLPLGFGPANLVRKPR